LSKKKIKLLFWNKSSYIKNKTKN